ncbi:MAG: DUF1707 and DUF2154 domain-containing protein [Solirubrobacterales bacterium]|nr:DUF1707 and DUF2154 domain-containing protein [Solirubrobacterales bacterium]
MFDDSPAHREPSGEHPAFRASDAARPALRASDAEREQTAETLRQAMGEGRLTVEELEDRLRAAYSAPTVGELERLVADVTVPDRVTRPAISPARQGGVTVREGPGGNRWIVGIMGGHDRKGRWRLAGRCTVINIMGGSDLDLNDVELSDRVTQLNVYSLMGGSEIWVPDGVNVEVSNVAIMGGNDVELGDEVAQPGRPLIRLRLVSIMAGTDVFRGRKLTKAERRSQKELRKREDRLLVENKLVAAEGEEQRHQAPGDGPADGVQERHVELPEAQNVNEDPGEHDRVDDDRGQR